MSTQTPREVSDELAQNSDNVALVDVRTQEEWNTVRIPDAMHIPLSELADRIDDLRAYKKVFLHCQSGGRSARATALLETYDVPAYNMVGGISAWQQDGLPVIHS